MKILITGGTGMVGQHLQEMFSPDEIWQGKVVFVGSKDYDLTKKYEVKNMFAKYKPDTVIHLAAKVGGIQDNIANPVEFLEDNLLINANVVLEAQKYRVVKFIGIGSTCAYPDKVEDYPMTEDMLHIGEPTASNFGYGYAKRMLAVHLKTIRESKGLDYFTIFPSNLYSEFDNFEDDTKAHFITALLKKIKNSDGIVPLLGTGRPLRQFIHAEDLARIIMECLDRVIKTDFNVCDDNRSIKVIAEAALYATLNKQLELKFDNDNGKDGQYRKDCSNQKLLKLFPGFQFIPLENGLKRVYNAL
tara:strand:+ start:2481 stop:3386 length:906 start_codon:yes stop_codon:yes gene_type:complete